MPDAKELSRDEKKKIRDDRREKKRQNEDHDVVPQESTPAKPPSTLKMMSKISTTTTTTTPEATPSPPKPSHPMPVLPLHMRPQQPRPQMENVPYFSSQPVEEQDGEGHGEGGVAKGKYSHYAQQVRKAVVPRSPEIPHSVEETKENLKEELERLAHVPKYIEDEEQTEILNLMPKLEKRVSKYTLALEGVHVEDSGSGSDTDNHMQEEEEEIMSPEEPLPKIRERYLSLASGEVVLDESGNLIPRERTESDPALREAESLEARKYSYDKALEAAGTLDVGVKVIRPHSPVPKIRERYLDVARGLSEPKQEDPEVEAHREALMQQLRDADLQKRKLEEQRMERSIEEQNYQEERKKEMKEKPNVPVKKTKKEYLSRMAAPIPPLPDDESIVAKPSTPVNAIKNQLAAAANKSTEPLYHGIDPITQEFISGDIDQTSLPGYGMLKWRYTPKEEVQAAPRQKPKLRPLDECSWVAVDAVERQPKEPAWKECLELLNLRVHEEMKSPSPQE